MAVLRLPCLSALPVDLADSSHFSVTIAFGVISLRRCHSRTRLRSMHGPSKLHILLCTTMTALCLPMRVLWPMRVRLPLLSYHTPSPCFSVFPCSCF
ncbi:hypothetical protein FA95DRAFT_1560889 [Auriscalpium vulgare]|uniref:Uncharacterized protein n=1 Tax=Auriscalpium vulgare TaxID=40419 RepID=A0ACB8RP46_9AGAM|nr:hypothetical protein FA95DRAFT_1560889 [Auriscalpium vulgare]